MPGKLIEAHAKLEKSCANCHSPFSPKAQNDLCASCHKEVASDVKAKRGLHGMRPDVAANECRHCHADHKGRDADIVRFDPATFDHALTNFQLKGKHALAQCDGCHQKEKKFRQTPSACVDCHRKDEPHGGRLGRECATCHNANGWSEIKGYDHAKTKFPLTGRHADVACRSCHAGERYKGAPVLCADCHKQQDVHRGQNGNKCETCHKTTGWKGVGFDHDSQTKFPLLGKHRPPLACEKCHEQDPHVVKLKTTCISCHKKDDKHRGQLGEDCLSCHGEGGWKLDTKFDHALSRFPLHGKHATTKCEQCHKTPAYKDAPIACSGCHSDQKTHDGRLGSSCGLCHGVNDWKHARFDHNSQTHFKLTGRHASTGCYACHTTRAVDKVKLASDCYSCHKSQDRHHGAFGRDCGRCHTPATFGAAFIRK